MSIVPIRDNDGLRIIYSPNLLVTYYSQNYASLIC